MRMVMVMIMMIAVETIAVFANGVIIGSLNRIRMDWTWIKHNFVVGLYNFLGSQELEPSSTNLWLECLDLTKLSQNKSLGNWTSAEQEQTKSLMSWNSAEQEQTKLLGSF